MTWFALIIIIHIGQSGTSAVTVPDYRDLASCEAAGNAAKKAAGVYDAFCIPAPAKN